MSIIDTLITDRTAEDVSRLRGITARIEDNIEHERDAFAGLTPEEHDAWIAGMKGGYYASDLNRVEAAVKYLTELLHERGYTASTRFRTGDWVMPDYPTASDAERYLGNVRALIDVFAVFPETPGPPESMNELDYKGANDIERILFDIERLYQNMLRTIDLGWTVNIAHIGLYGGL